MAEKTGKPAAKPERVLPPPRSVADEYLAAILDELRTLNARLKEKRT